MFNVPPLKSRKGPVIGSGSNPQRINPGLTPGGGGLYN